MTVNGSKMVAVGEPHTHLGAANFGHQERVRAQNMKAIEGNATITITIVNLF